MHEDCESLPDEEDALDDSFQYDSPNEDLDDFKIPDISVIPSLCNQLTSYQQQYSDGFVKWLKHLVDPI